LDAREILERAKRSASATEEELKVLDKFFAVERSAAGAPETFRVMFSEQKAALFSAALAAEGEKNAVHGAAGAEGIDGIGRGETEFFKAVEGAVIAHGVVVRKKGGNVEPAHAGGEFSPGHTGVVVQRQGADPVAGAQAPATWQRGEPPRDRVVMICGQITWRELLPDGGERAGSDPVRGAVFFDETSTVPDWMWADSGMAVRRNVHGRLLISWWIDLPDELRMSSAEAREVAEGDWR
jgi:hypothetical protein